MQWYRPGGRRLGRVGLLTLLVASSIGMSAHAGAANGNAQSERERVRREQAKAASELDLLRAEDKEVTAGLRTMNDQVTAQQQLLATAQQAVQASEVEVLDAKTVEVATQQRVVKLQQSLRTMVVQEYITGGRLRLGAMSLETSDLSEQARRSVLAGFVVGNTTAVAGELRSASEDLTLARKRAEAAAAAAVARRTEVDARLGELGTARDQQAAFASRLDDRIEAGLAEAAALASLDSQLSAQIAQQQAALARANAGRRSPGRTTVVGRVRLRTVRGITVNVEIADQLERLLAAASADGITFGGGGYRDPQQQQQLREAHCPDPDRSPSSSCRPPTARPGHSMHERGLAIDFTVGGRILNRSSAGYRWLRANAATYGLYNLPSEAWHWSSNGN